MKKLVVGFLALLLCCVGCNNESSSSNNKQPAYGSYKYLNETAEDVFGNKITLKELKVDDNYFYLSGNFVLQDIKNVKNMYVTNGQDGIKENIDINFSSTYNNFDFLNEESSFNGNAILIFKNNIEYKDKEKIYFDLAFIEHNYDQTSFVIYTNQIVELS